MQPLIWLHLRCRWLVLPQGLLQPRQSQQHPPLRQARPCQQLQPALPLSPCGACASTRWPSAAGRIQQWLPHAFRCDVCSCCLGVFDRQQGPAAPSHFGLGDPVELLQPGRNRHSTAGAASMLEGVAIRLWSRQPRSRGWHLPAMTAGHPGRLIAKDTMLSYVAIGSTHVAQTW